MVLITPVAPLHVILLTNAPVPPNREPPLYAEGFITPPAVPAAARAAMKDSRLSGPLTRLKDCSSPCMPPQMPASMSSVNGGVDGAHFFAASYDCALSGVGCR